MIKDYKNEQTKLLFEDDKFVLKYDFDQRELLKQNARERNSGKFDTEGGILGAKVASVPNWVILKWKQDYGVDLMTCGMKDLETRNKVYRLLDSNEWKYLKTTNRRLATANQSENKTGQIIIK